MTPKSSAWWDTSLRPSAPAVPAKSSTSNSARSSPHPRVLRTAPPSKSRKRFTSSATKKASLTCANGKISRTISTAPGRPLCRGPPGGKDRERNDNEYDRVDNGHGHPGGNLPAGSIGQAVSKKRPQG